MYTKNKLIAEAQRQWPNRIAANAAPTKEAFPAVANAERPDSYQRRIAHLVRAVHHLDETPKSPVDNGENWY